MIIVQDAKVDFEQILSRMEGWCKPHKAQRLYELVMETDSQLSVELGVFGGKSLIALALGHKHKGSGVVLGFDPWNNKACLEDEGNDPKNNEWWASLDMEKIYQSCLFHMKINDVEGFCETIRLRNQGIANAFADETFDIIHQDGNHNFTAITGELKAWIPKLKMGGLWIADDTSWIETQEGYALLPTFGLEKIETHAYDDGTEWQVWRKIK